MAEEDEESVWAWKTSWKRCAVDVNARVVVREVRRERRLRDVGLARRPCRPRRC